MYLTFEYARIVCKHCNKEVQKLIPGTPFGSLAICECQKKEVKEATEVKETKDAKRRQNTKES